MIKNILSIITVITMVLVAGCGEKISPEEYERLKKTGIEQAKNGEFSKAVETLEKASSAKPEDADIYPPLAESYENIGSLEKAIETWQKYIFILPRNSQAARNGLSKLNELEAQKRNKSDKAE